MTYQEFIDKYLEDKTFKLSKNDNNSITGTFKYDDEYVTFKKNFGERIKRLKAIYEKSPKFCEIKKTLNLVADNKNWQGAYAELVAFDILNNSDIRENPVDVECEFEAKDSFAEDFGKSKTNLDGCIKECRTSFDVKIMADAVGNILDSVIKKASEDCDRCSVLPEYRLEDDESVYNQNFSKLVDELHESLQKKENFLKSSVADGLSYNINWDEGMNSSVNTYDPYAHAEKFKNVLIKRYSYKFLKNSPFFLVMVNFPWYNQLMRDDNSNSIFYRSLARRNFCDMRQIDMKMKDLVSSFKIDCSIRDVTKKLSGIIFIDDLSVTEDGYNAYLYLNPNADNKNSLIRRYFEKIIKQANKGCIDDFVHDNY